MRLGLALALVGVLAGPTSADDLPDLDSPSAVVLDAATGSVLFAKGADDVRPIASTTKIFVAIAVRGKQLDLAGWTSINRVDVRHARGGARTRLDINRAFRNHDLLRAMLISSDNRAPTALGRAVGLDPDGLVAAMNQVAKRLGLAHTRFTDPSGLNGNVSTARELALGLRAALDDRVLRDIMGDPSQLVVSKDHRLKISYHSTNVPLVVKKYDVIGGKTGFTRPAGYCYVTAARIRGRTVLVALLGGKRKAARWRDFNRLAAWVADGAPKGKHARPARGGRRGRVAKP